METVASFTPDVDISPLQLEIQTWVSEHPIKRDFIFRDTVAPQLASIIGDQAMDALQTVGTLAIGVEELADRFSAHVSLLTNQARWQAERVFAQTASRADMEGGLAMLAGVADSVYRCVPIAEQSAALMARWGEAFFEELRQERIDVLSNIERQAVIGRYCFSQITATHQAVCGHNYPEKGAIIIYCFVAVSRTRGRKIASRTINWRNPFLKEPHAFLHCMSER